MQNTKSLKPATHYIFWSVFTLLLIFALFLLKAVLLPFVAGIAIAYILNPPVRKLGQLGIKRGPASIIILSGFLAFMLALTASIIPPLVKELGAFIEDAPVYINQIKSLLTPLSSVLEEYTGQAGIENADIKGALIDNSQSVTTIIKAIGSKLAAGGQTIIDIFSLLVFTPVVAFFVMKEWGFITSWLYDLVPHHARKDVSYIMRQIDEKLSGFIRGQLSVAFILALVYAIALIAAGLKYGFLIGIVSGILSVIPLLGSMLGLVISIGVAWAQSGDLGFVLIIAGIFLGGQLIEGNILTPKLVGDSVGLHPLWIFFALFAGGALLGILGMFLAVPIAASIGVLFSYVLKKYKQSAYYLEASKNSESSQEEKRNKK